MPRHLPDRDPIELAARALRRHDRSRHELDERLAKEGIGETERDEALDALERVGYLDDGRLAAGRAQSLADRGRGDEAIRFDLEQRGIDATAIEDALASLEPEAVRAAALVARLGCTPKTAAQLRRNGFSEDSVEGAVGEAVAGGGA